MYTHNGNLNGQLQEVVRLNFESKDDSTCVRSTHDFEMVSHAEEDPLLDCVWTVAQELLAEMDRITIRDVCEKAPVGKSAARDRLNALRDREAIERVIELRRSFKNIEE